MRAARHWMALLAALVLAGAQACNGSITYGSGGSGGSSGGGGATGTGGAAGSTSSAGCVAELEVGLDRACAVRTDGTVWCWGRNDALQVDPGGADVLQPVQVKGFGGAVTAVSVDGGHTCAIDDKGALWCWGNNDVGQLGDGTTDSSSTPRRVAALGTTVVAVSVGGAGSCAIDDGGALWCWGNNSVGAVGDGTTTERHLPVKVPGLPGKVEQVSCGTCAVVDDGTVWCWGGNMYGALGVPITDPGPNGDDFTRSPARVPSLDGVAQVVRQGTCALKHDRTLWCWGMNDQGQLGTGVQADPYTPAQVTALGSAVVQVAAGGEDACAVKTDKTLWCWGGNAFGEVGDGTKLRRDTPVQVKALGAHVVAVGAGLFDTCALTDDGTLWCWGKNNHGQLGNGTTTDSPLPVKVKFGCP